MEKLVEAILLQAELLDLKTDFETNAKGIVLESKIDIGRGPVANIIVTAGTLKKGDYFVSGLKWGKIRAIINDHGKNIDNAEPATPIEIIGITTIEIGKIKINKTISNKYLIVLTLNKNNLTSLNKKFYIKVR